MKTINTLSKSVLNRWHFVLLCLIALVVLPSCQKKYHVHIYSDDYLTVPLGNEIIIVDSTGTFIGKWYRNVASGRQIHCYLKESEFNKDGLFIGSKIVLDKKGRIVIPQHTGGITVINKVHPTLYSSASFKPTQIVFYE